MFPTSNAKTFTRTFESKLFPAFSVSSVNLKSTYNENSSFIEKFNKQLEKINNIINQNVMAKDYIVKVDGSKVEIKKDFYKNVPDFILDTICEYGIEKGIAYQVFRMIYGYKIETVQVFNGESYDTLKFCNCTFDISKYKSENINPLSSLWFKYSVIMTEKEVKTAIYSKESDIPMRYFVKINTPTPVISTEIIARQISKTSLKFKIPDIFDNTLKYLELIVNLPEENISDIKKSLCKDGNVFLSQIRVLNNDIFLKFDGLTITNDFYLNRRAAQEQEQDGVDSTLFFKIKLEEIAISIEEDRKISSRAKTLSNKRMENDKNLKNNNNEEPLHLSISRAKRIMHGVKNNKASQ